jgi:hypothetical protein
MANEKKPNVKEVKNSKLLEVYLKKQEQDDRQIEHTSVKGRHI